MKAYLLGGIGVAIISIGLWFIGVPFLTSQYQPTLHVVVEDALIEDAVIQLLGPTVITQIMDETTQGVVNAADVVVLYHQQDMVQTTNGVWLRDGLPEGAILDNNGGINASIAFDPILWHFVLRYMAESFRERFPSKASEIQYRLNAEISTLMTVSQQLKQAILNIPESRRRVGVTSNQLNYIELFYGIKMVPSVRPIATINSLALANQVIDHYQKNGVSVILLDESVSESVRDWLFTSIVSKQLNIQLSSHIVYNVKNFDSNQKAGYNSYIFNTIDSIVNQIH